MLQTSSQAKHFRDYFKAMRIESISMDKLCDGDVAFCGERRQQIKTLKHETNFVPAKLGALRVAHGGQLIAIH